MWFQMIKALCVNGNDSVTSFTGGNAEFFAKTGVTVYEPKAITFSDVEVKGGSSSEAAQPIKIPTSAEELKAYPYFAVNAKQHRRNITFGWAKFR